MNEREEWLTGAARILNENVVSPTGVSLPHKWKISCGFAWGNKKAIGQAVDAKTSLDGETYNIFISPMLGNQDKVNLMQTIAHEIIHCAVGLQEKHGGEFKRVARAIGLEGRLTATYVSPGSPLAVKLLEAYELVGYEYPHKEIVIQEKEKKPRAKNYDLYVSVNDPLYKVKIAKDLLEDYGAPCDYEGTPMIPDEE